jgi:hypothetical protein
VNLSSEYEFGVPIVPIPDLCAHPARANWISQVMMRMQWDRTGVELVSHSVQQFHRRLEAAVSRNRMRRDRDGTEITPPVYLFQPAILTWMLAAQGCLSKASLSAAAARCVTAPQAAERCAAQFVRGTP